MLKSSKHSCQYSFFEAKVVYAHRVWALCSIINSDKALADD